MAYGQLRARPMPGYPTPPLQTPDQSTEVAPSPAQIREQLGQALSQAQDKLYEARTVFPFTLFPDVLVIDRSQVSISHRAFWQVAEVISVRIEDILNVTANVGPFFGSIIITTRFFNDKTPAYEVHWLWREDALKAKRILQGYVIATKRKINCTALDTRQLSVLLDELGKGTPEEQT
ncbi:MAG TPA: hypothetical protein VLE73_05715 [Candidatus Saccharimonadales bacterium]|nr:hypothetical protein [Candidatus Saccharimonadales bacterium]